MTGLLTLACAVALASNVGRAEPRVRLSLNDCWRFAEGGLPGASDAHCDDSGWAGVTLPHTWNTSDVFDKGGAGPTVRVDAKVGGPALDIVRLSSR